MKEFFVVANSKAAPFVSDTSHEYVEGPDPDVALERFRASYRHPSGLYAVQLYRNADDYHKRAAPVAQWLSEEAEYVTANAGHGDD